MSEPTEGQQPSGGRGAASSAGTTPSTATSASVATGSSAPESSSSAGSSRSTGSSTSSGSTGSSASSGSSTSVTTPAGTEVDATAASSSKVEAAGPSEAVLGPFTTRELVFGGGVLLVFIGTLLPFVGGRVLYTTFWSSASLFFVGIGILLPVIALALLAGRRLGSAGLRVGSLSVDQFASVTAVLAATFFFLQTVTAFQIGPFIALIGSLGLLAATVVGAYIPVVKNDFLERAEVPAHALARPIAAAKPRLTKPKAPKPEKPASQGTGSGPRTTVDSSPSDAASHGSRTQPADGGAGIGAAATGASGLFGASAGRQDSSDSRGTNAAGRNEKDERAGSPTPHEQQGSTDHDGAPAKADAAAGAAAAVEPSAGGDVGHERKADAGGRSTGGADTDTRAFGAASDSTRVHESVRDDSAAHTAERKRQEPITATRSADDEDVVEAFWFAVGSPRPVFDEHTGREIFTLQPGDWEVGIEDRGREFLVQDKRSGSVGILRDLRHIERAPRD